MINNSGLLIAVMFLSAFVLFLAVSAVTTLQKWCNRLTAIAYCQAFFSDCSERLGHPTAHENFFAVVTLIDEYELTYDELGRWSKAGIAQLALRAMHRHMAVVLIRYREMKPIADKINLKSNNPTLIDWQDRQIKLVVDGTPLYLENMRTAYKNFKFTVQQVVGRFLF